MLKKVLKFLDDHLEEYLMAILLCVLTLVMLLQIIMRFIFNDALSWPEELCRYCFVYITFFTLGFCTKRNTMLKLDIIQNILPSKVWTALQIIVRVTTLVFFAIMFVSSLDLLESMQKTNRVSTALQIPYFYIYLSTTLGFGLALFRSIQSCIVPVARFIRKKGKEEK